MNAAYWSLKAYQSSGWLASTTSMVDFWHLHQPNFDHGGGLISHAFIMEVKDILATVKRNLNTEKIPFGDPTFGE